MNLLEELTEHLEWCGFGTMPTDEVSGDLYWGRMPDEPDNCTAVFSTDSGTGGPNSTARFQIMVRSRQPRYAYELAYNIANELEDFNGFLHGDGPHVVIEVINAAAGLGADVKKREVYVSNVMLRYCT